MSILGKSVLATSAAAVLFSLSVAAPAQAGGKKHFHFPHKHHHHIHGYGYGFGPSYYVGGGYGCGYYKKMFWKTGNYYWKAKYYDCLY